MKMTRSFNNTGMVGIPTTKFEKDALHFLKYNIIQDNEFCPELLPYEIASKLLSKLYKLEILTYEDCLERAEKDDSFSALYFDGTESKWCLFEYESFKGYLDWDGHPVEDETSDYFVDRTYDDYISTIPDNVSIIIASYRMVGKHRKVAMLKKKYRNNWYVQEA